ncbi:MAG: acetylglutamate kinase [Hydrogenibacillus schlegelii]|nr:acetylglutamate kinase [Hydrogenibacillus schlegelii]
METGGLVIKIGGSVLDAAGAAWFGALKALADERPVVVVHGGGPAIDARLKALGLAIEKRGGLRVTDAATLAVVEGVLAGELNGALVRTLLRAGVPAWGVSGAAARLIAVDPKDGGALGRVGTIRAVDPAPLRAIQKAGCVPVVAPLGLGPDGEAYNVNADEAAAALAAALGYGVVFVSDVPGVLVETPSGRTVLPALTAAEAEAHIAGGAITGGMIPKVRAAVRAVEGGAPAAWIVGAEPVALLAVGRLESPAAPVPSDVQGAPIGTRIVADGADGSGIGDRPAGPGLRAEKTAESAVAAAAPAADRQSPTAFGGVQAEPGGAGTPGAGSGAAAGDAGWGRFSGTEGGMSDARVVRPL